MEEIILKQETGTHSDIHISEAVAKPFGVCIWLFCPFSPTGGPALTPEPHSPSPPPMWDITMKNMKTEQSEGGALNPFLTVPGQVLRVTLYQVQPHPLSAEDPSLNPSLLDCDRPGVASWLSLPYQAHWGPTYNPNPHLLPLFCLASPLLPLQAIRALGDLPQPRSLSLRARPLPAGSTGWSCQAESNWPGLFGNP